MSAPDMSALGVADYAVSVEGDAADAMQPRYRDRELLYLSRSRKAEEGDDVIVNLHNGRRHLAQLCGRTDTTISCRQYNRPGEVVFDLADVRSIDVVIRATEMFR